VCGVWRLGEAFRGFISRNSLNYDILAKIPYPISEIIMIPWLENSLQRCPQFDTPIGTCKFTNTSVATRTYSDLVSYLSAQYSSLSPDTPSRGGNAFGATDDPNNIVHGQGKKQKRSLGKGDKGKGGGKGNDSKRQHQQKHQAPQAHAAAAADSPEEHRNGWEEDTTAMATSSMDCHPSISSTGSDADANRQIRTAEHRFYCAVNGHNITHKNNGINCRSMLRDPAVYYNQHLQAKNIGHCANPAVKDKVQYLRPRLHWLRRRKERTPRSSPPSPAQRMRHAIPSAVPHYAANIIPAAQPSGSYYDPPPSPQRVKAHNSLRVSLPKDVSSSLMWFSM
jgi:hypothetical protein